MTSTTSQGLLKWGQAGEFNAHDDRLVITALANGLEPGADAVALVKPPTLSAGSGLTVNIGPWHAIVDCGDGTLAVIGNRSPDAFQVPAGPGSGAARTDVLWADIDVDPSTWQIMLLPQSATVNRLGIRLGTILAPSGPNGSLASNFTLTPALPSFNVFPLMRAAPHPVQGGGDYDPTKPVRMWSTAFEYSTNNGYLNLPLPEGGNWTSILQVQVTPYLRNLASHAVMIYPQFPATAARWTGLAQVRWLSDATWFTGWVAGMCNYFYQL